MTAPATPPGESTAPAAPEPASPRLDATPAAQTTAAAPTSEPSAPAPLALQGFGRALSELFATRQAYPRLAAMRGWEGEVRLRIHIARKGSIVSVELAQSSGFDLLDQSAIKLVEASGPLPPLPEALQGREFEILVPVQYRLARAG